MTKHTFINRGPSLWILNQPTCRSPPSQIDCFKTPFDGLVSTSPPHCCKFRRHTSAGVDNCGYSLTDPLMGRCHRLIIILPDPDMFVQRASERRNDNIFCYLTHSISRSDMDQCWSNYTGYILVRSQGRNINDRSPQHLTNTNPKCGHSMHLENHIMSVEDWFHWIRLRWYSKARLARLHCLKVHFVHFSYCKYLWTFSTAFEVDSSYF